MKRLFAILLFAIIVLSLGACASAGNSKGDDNTVNTVSDNNDFVISGLPDYDVVGAWEQLDSETPTTVIFTSECTLQFVYGSTVAEGEIEYYTDENGKKCAVTNGFNFRGELTYSIKDNHLSISKLEDGEVIAVLRKIDNYEYKTPAVYDNFTPDTELVGNWMTEYETYKFTEEGYVIGSSEYDDGNVYYTIETTFTYTAENGVLTLKSYDPSGEEVVETYDYSIDGDVFDFGGIDFYRDGKGMPESAE